jgi:hypothetical protein
MGGCGWSPCDYWELLYRMTKWGNVSGSPKEQTATCMQDLERGAKMPRAQCGVSAGEPPHWAQLSQLSHSLLVFRAVLGELLTACEVSTTEGHVRELAAVFCRRHPSMALKHASEKSDVLVADLQGHRLN